MRTKTLLLSAVLAVGLTMAGGAGAQTTLSIATGGTGGVYYPLGGGLGNILGKELPGTTATAQVTGGSVANLQLIGSGKADLAFSQVDAAWDAVNGLDKFPAKLPIRAIAVLYPNHMHVVTVEGTGINKIEDMKGKRISTGSPVLGLRPRRASLSRRRKDPKPRSSIFSPRFSDWMMFLKTSSTITSESFLVSSAARATSSTSSAFVISCP